MTGPNGSGRERLLGLMADRATQGLSDAKADELNRLLGDHPDVEPDGLDLAAAAAELAFLSSETREREPLPAALRERLLVQARAHFSAPREVVDGPSRRPAKSETARPRRIGHSAGWIAAAAMLVVAVLAWWPGRPPSAPTLAEARQSLIDSAPDLVQVAWAPSEVEGFERVEGDVVWSNETQAGYMRLRGMPVNDPSREQYQLWIVDPERDVHPVDGGVFDIGDGVSEVVVPIVAKLDVIRPAAFAITVEQPGGVVVSDGPLVVVASVTS